MKIKQKTNSAGVSYQFPIELDNSDEEDDFELTKGGNDNVCISDYYKSNTFYKHVGTNSIVVKVGKHIEVDIGSRGNDEDKVRVK